jgi:hypothetical protein
MFIGVRTTCKRAKIEGVTFSDLRGTAVTRLALVGCSESEIATITGHSIRDVRSILVVFRQQVINVLLGHEHLHRPQTKALAIPGSFIRSARRAPSCLGAPPATSSSKKSPARWACRGKAPPCLLLA